MTLLDIHGHPPRDPGDVPAYIAALERFDSRLLVSDLGSRTRGWEHEPDVQHWQEGNARCAELVRAHPERLLGYCYVNPAHGREALDEMERRLLGEPEVFAALKLWVAVRCSDPRLDPLMEFCAAYGVPVLQHTWMKVGPGGPGSGNLPGESTPADLLALARRHPRVTFFGGHTGGDWEWGAAALKQVDNVWLDIGGGEATGGYMEVALRAVGAGRIVYGTDVPGRSVPSQLAKALAAGLADEDLERILWRNAAGVLGDRLPPAWKGAFPLTPGPSPRRGREELPLTPSPSPTPERGEPVANQLAGSRSPFPPREGGSRTTAARTLFDTNGAAVARHMGVRPSDELPRVPAPGPGGYVDANSYLGEWPSRLAAGSLLQSRQDLVDERLRQMDRLGIRRAAVSLLEGVWLKDSGSGNDALHDLVGDRADRFFPVYTLNPSFPAWPEHLDRCVETYGLAPGRGALRLHPGYHGYQLDDQGVGAFLERIAVLGLPVALPVQLEDARTHHPAMRVPDLDVASVVALVRRWPQVRWIVAAAVHGQVVAIGRQVPPEAQVWFDISRVQGPIDGIRLMRDAVGIHRILFGTNLPLHVAESAVMELADARLSAEEDAAVRYGNARQALGLA